MKIAVQLVVWNGAKYLPKLIDSLKAQTFSDWELLVLDNGSSDETLKVLGNEIFGMENPVSIFGEKENIGFAPGHNKLFGNSHSEYVLLLNQDIILEKDVLEKLCFTMDKEKSLGSAAPKLLRLVKGEKTNIVDSLGIKVLKNRRVMDNFSGEKWEDISTKFRKGNVSVFGVSGALPIYRREAVEMVGKNLFDPKYFSYKEDFDLAWRLQNFGYDSKVVLEAVAYHERTGKEPIKKDSLSAGINKKKQSELVRYNSYKNHLRTIIKNDAWQNLLLDFPFILWYEFRKLFFFLIFDRKTLIGLKEIWFEKKILLDERKRILEGSKWKKLRKWFHLSYE